MFMDDERKDWPLFRSVTSTREAFVDGTQILVAIGGWGDTGFSTAAQNDTTRKAFAQNVVRMVQMTGADGACDLPATVPLTREESMLPGLLTGFYRC